MVLSKSARVAACLFAVALLLAVIIPAFRVSALNSSSLTLSEGRPSQVSSYSFQTSGLDTGTTINCIQLDIGTAVDGTGDAGLTVAAATLGTNTIPSGGTWTVSAVEGTDQLRATSAGGAVPNASGNTIWNNVTNGTTADTTYFGVFSTYGNVDCTTGGPIDTVVVTLIFKNGSLVSLTIDPSLTFTVAGVSDTAETVNGVSTTVTSTPTAIDFQNNVTSLVKGVSAHDLTVGTNATGGYTLYIKHTGLLTNGASDTIDNWTGTNAAPTAFPAAGTEAWGYTTEDGTLLTGTANRFTNGGDFWSGFNTVNEIVGDSNAPATNETTRVGHQVGVSASTEAGTYQTTIVYTVASVY